MRDRVLTEPEDEVLNSEAGEPCMLLELAELTCTETVSVIESVSVDVDVMLDAELPVLIGVLELAGAVGDPDGLLVAPVLRDTPVLSDGVGNGYGP